MALNLISYYNVISYLNNVVILLASVLQIKYSRPVGQTLPPQGGKGLASETSLNVFQQLDPPWHIAPYLLFY